jgi:hypothetical protein
MDTIVGVNRFSAPAGHLAFLNFSDAHKNSGFSKLIRRVGLWDY